MYTVAIQAGFSAAHYHRGAARECEQIHGHNYRVEVVVESMKLAGDMVIDFKILGERVREVTGKWDHRLLNELDDFKDVSPTTENIARLLYRRLKKGLSQYNVCLQEVKVWEKDDCWASYRK